MATKKPRSRKVDSTTTKKRRKKNTRSITSLRRFHAFDIENVEKKKYGKVKKNYEAISPEHGIHSLEWSLAIVPQTCGLLRLPIEQRMIIWECVIHSIFKDHDVEPRKIGNGFHCSMVQYGSRDILTLSLVSRQIYVDVAGGALLYKTKQFYFSNQLELLKYLPHINPAHKDAIRSLHLQYHLTSSSPKSPQSKAFTVLAECKGLQHLQITFTTHLRSNTYYRTHPLGGVSPRPDFIPTRIYECVGKFKEWKAISNLGLKSFEILFKMLRWGGTVDIVSIPQGPDPIEPYSVLRDDLQKRLTGKTSAPE